jgi:peptidoglycan/xylan/chitin deacetylase (PgdA/CDA1 family)
VQAQLRVRGLAELYWDVDPSDYLRPGAAVIARRVLAALHPGAIVIMHDGGGGNRSPDRRRPARHHPRHPRGRIPDRAGLRG